MKLTYFGTAAAEGFPAVFCRCSHCLEARRLGGKNIRTRSQSLINDDLLIDLPADTYFHFLQNNVEGDKIAYLLITHAHSDHFYPQELNVRIKPYAHNVRVPVLKMFCSSFTLKHIHPIPRDVEITVLKPFETVEMGPYRVTPLPARHMPEGEPFIYVIQGDKTLLYAHDTGYFFEEVFDYIEKSKLVFDMVSLDCTNGDLPISDEGGHMGFPNNQRVLERLTAMGAVTDKTVKYVNHFSHNAGPLQAQFEERAATIGCSVSYDGCTVEF